MKHILKVASLQNLPNTRPLIAMDENGNLFGAGEALVPEGFVDFGLPSGTLWYSKNLGATNGDTSTSWYGDYYAWGETEEKDYYSWETYEHANGDSHKLTKYCNNSEYGNEGYTDELTELVPTDDVAVSLGWKMPSKEQFEELLVNTVSSWETDYQDIAGLNGRLFVKILDKPFKNIPLYMPFDEQGQPSQELHLVTDDVWAYIAKYSKLELDAMVSEATSGQITDANNVVFKDQLGTLATPGTDFQFSTHTIDSTVSMFIPAAGHCNGYSLYNTGSYGNYWSSSLILDHPSNACLLNFNSGDSFMNSYIRVYGQSIRPVLQN